ncbi:MAG: hypothetical protein HY020_08905 [Burkholderiales bacterium]|nr:hypothetical protein [Burkholderiales bacterium]
MKLRSSLIALACLASFGAAHALTPAEIVTARGDGSLKEVRLAGASALRLLVGAYIQADLADASTFDVFFDSTAGSNYRAYSFKTKVVIGTWPVGTPVVIYKRDAGGSAQGVTPLVNADATQTHMLIDGSCTTGTGPSPATDIQKAGFICASTTPALAHAGFSDVEPALLQAVINGGTGLDTSSLDAAGFVQNIFAVGVNKKLYLALQKAQGLVAANATAIDESAAAQPSIPKTFIAGALTGQILGSAASKKGWNLLIPSSVDSNINNKRVNVCRRTPGSGTQAASNVYFANNPCGGSTNQFTPTAGTTSATLAVTGSITTLQNSSTGAVETCLGNVEALADGTGGGYAFGVLGRENNPQAIVNGVPSEKGYRYVKLSGATPSRAALISGEYDFAVEASMQWPKSDASNAPAADILALLTKMRSEMGKAAILQGLDADLQNGLAALPSTVTGAWADLDATTKSFTSHTNRISANSCSFVRMTK